MTLILLATTSCGPALQVREVRPGVQHDSAGRSFVESRRMTATICNEAGRPPVAEPEVRSRLSISAQDQGYSGVAGVTCVNSAPPPCAGGITCGGVAVRFVEGNPSATGSSCDPPCAGTSRCEEGLCVPTCEPPCTGSNVCVQGGQCQPSPP
jgi:hypothetical protein